MFYKPLLLQLLNSLALNHRKFPWSSWCVWTICFCFFGRGLLFILEFGTFEKLTTALFLQIFWMLGLYFLMYELFLSIWKLYLIWFKTNKRVVWVSLDYNFWGLHVTSQESLLHSLLLQLVDWLMSPLIWSDYVPFQMK